MNTRRDMKFTNKSTLTMISHNPGEKLFFILDPTKHVILPKMSINLF